VLSLDPGDSPGDGLARVGPAPGWAAAARSLGATLPEPVDGDARAAARATLRRLERTEASVRADLERAGHADTVRARAQALAAFLPRVPRGASRVSLPDPADPARTLDIELDPALKPHENADRLFRRAAKMERARERAPAHLAELARAIAEARAALEAIERGEISGVEAPPRVARSTAAPRPGRGAGARAGAGAGAAAGKRGAVPAALEPRRFRTSEGWEVWIGRSNQGNDHLTHRLARPEDVWMHVHGAAGSHVVLRRGKGPNEPSKATLVEVAGWAAFYSQARNAGTVPVTVTQKKYVRKPRKAPAGLAQVERSKTVFARPTEPPDDARIGADEA
jgi:predicted ribosome quality control (RQC) complex YloA/Tae2 family protein